MLRNCIKSIAVINENILQKKKYIKINYIKQIKPFLSLLVKLGYFLSYKIDACEKKTYYLCELNYKKNGLPVLNKIIPISKVSRKLYVSYLTLVKINKLNITLLLHTNNGFITSNEAIKLKIGGELFCVLL